MINATINKQFTLRSALRLFFLLAVTVPAAVTSIFYWQHLVSLNEENDSYVARIYAQNLEGIINLKHAEFEKYFEACKHTPVARGEITQSPLVFCGLKRNDGSLTQLFLNGINSDSFRLESIKASSWWPAIGAKAAKGWILEGETGIQPAYYKKYVLLYETTQQGVLFGLLDPLPLMSALISSANDISSTAPLSPVLTNGAGEILFAPQALFYNAFFSDKSYAKMLAQNPRLKPLAVVTGFSVDGIDFMLHFVTDSQVPNTNLNKLRAFLVYNFVFILLLGVAGVIIVLRSISTPVVSLAKELARFRKSLGLGGTPDFGNISTTETKIREISVLQGGIIALLDSLRDRDKRLDKLNQELKEKEILARIGQVSGQIAHDIRSPLAALQAGLGLTEELSEEHRLLFRSAITRIEDIANELYISTPHSPNQDNDSICLLTSLIEPLITEKRLQYRSRLNVEIQSSVGANSYGLFSRVRPSELKRLLSNLITNSVEAIPYGGKVDLILSAENNRCLLEVCDNGTGIEPEILEKLNASGGSWGKAKGSGKGLSHAREAIRSWGGKLTLFSKVGEGTRVSIELPKVEPPPWFVPELVLKASDQVVILDDDLSIHQVWQNRFKQLPLEIELLHFSQANQLAEFHSAAKQNTRVIYLLDYELLGETRTGLDMVCDLGLSENVFLVTSRFEEKSIRERCEQLGVRIIPKGLASHIPLRVR